MLEDNSYEPLAEVYLSVSDNCKDEDVYCLCSRVVIRGTLEDEDLSQELNEIDEGSNIKLGDVSLESNQQPTHKRKEPEEVLSCYCSASHCSTDEHDSVKETALHSDSGADLSESSKDLDWERYWSTHGERIVWESWISKYGEYIDPAFGSPTTQPQSEPYSQEDTQFNVIGAESGKKSFAGLLDAINEEAEKPSIALGGILELQDIDNSSETSDKSDFLSDEYFRLRSCSRSSGKSSLLTDSLTNITPMTIYSSELSCGAEESSGQSNSNSFISSIADSVCSNEQQWQQLWLDHFNEQYLMAYKVFMSKFINETAPAEIYNILEDKSFTDSSDYLKSPEINKVFPFNDIERNIEENKENIDLKEIELDCLSNGVNDKKKSFRTNIHEIRESHSVGYLLGSLKTLTMEVQVNDEQVSSKSGDENLQDMENGNSDAPIEISSRKKIHKALKRVHDKDDPSLDRVKGAFTLMGFVYKPAKGQIEDTQIKKAHVVYRKRNIRSHNRSLNMKSVQPRHIRFNDDGLPLIEKVKNFLQINNDAGDENATVGESSSTPEPANKWDVDDFSEKDDSSSGETFFSADEWGASVKQKERQKKKKMSKKKKTKLRNLPKEILENNKLIKYWYNRYRLFSLYDRGIKLDEESWYSVTPEKVSKHTAERCRCDLIVDACCGAGGNAIQFAFSCERVIAIDIDPEKVKLARHNARIYGVEDRIEFITGNFFHLAPKLVADVVFLSPPWGGPNYMASESYRLEDISVEGGGKALFKAASAITSNIAYFLPKTVNTDQLVKLVGPGGAVEIEQNFLDKKLIAVTAYFGELVESI